MNSNVFMDCLDGQTGGELEAEGLLERIQWQT